MPEDRSDTGSGPRIIRVGTHALKTGSRTTLWTRLSQHKGQPGSGGGNHRGLIFRLIGGRAVGWLEPEIDDRLRARTLVYERTKPQPRTRRRKASFGLSRSDV